MNDKMCSRRTVQTPQDAAQRCTISHRGFKGARSTGAQPTALRTGAPEGHVPSSARNTPCGTHHDYNQCTTTVTDAPAVHTAATDPPCHNNRPRTSPACVDSAPTRCCGVLHPPHPQPQEDRSRPTLPRCGIHPALPLQLQDADGEVGHQPDEHGGLPADPSVQVAQQEHGHKHQRRQQQEAAPRGGP